MSSRANKLVKQVSRKLTFPAEMYMNLFGSLIICSYILNGGDVKHILKTWKKLSKNPDKYIDLEDENWMRDLCRMFKVEYDLTGRIVLVQGQYNSCFLIADEDGKLYPIREDGWMPYVSLSYAVPNKKVRRLVDPSKDPMEEVFEVAE